MSEETCAKETCASLTLFLRHGRRRIELVSRPIQEGEVDAPVGISWLVYLRARDRSEHESPGSAYSAFDRCSRDWAGLRLFAPLLVMGFHSSTNAIGARI